MLSLLLAIICFAQLWLVCPLGLLRIGSLADVVYMCAGFGFGNYWLLLCFRWCVHLVCFALGYSLTWFTCVLSVLLAIFRFCFALLWLVCPLGLLRIGSLADVVYLRAGFGFGNYLLLLLLCFALLWLVCPLALLRIGSVADVVYMCAEVGFGNYWLLLCFALVGVSTWFASH